MKKMTGLLVVVSVSLGSLVPVYAMEPQVGDVIELELGQLKPTQSSIGYDQIFYKLGRYHRDPKAMFDELCESNGQKGVKHYTDVSLPNDNQSYQCKDEIGAHKDKMKTVVIGPDGQYFLTDGHHTFNVFYQMPNGGEKLRVNVLIDKDYRQWTDWPTFWGKMVAHGDAWLFDEQDRPIDYNQLPTKLGISNFSDDQYRSLVYFVKGVAWYKPTQAIPFLEFYWARELRSLMEGSQFDLSTQQGFRDALKVTSRNIVAIQSRDVGSSGMSAEQLGQWQKVDTKELEKLLKKKGKVTDALNYKAMSHEVFAREAAGFEPENK
ncbi:hypothetical protein ATY36_19290 [Vibrio cidicii]|uniref:ParB/Srx family N-terminal domain-containing protein n=1 Tax=Vibrio cidicii TaxID=1763883 RepID=UPI00077FE998|nr:ParB/Srx family N-terminal domain-containing protein [Vibrio cidicii]KYN80407.1 hypothetical protein ATY36_19290 [Vibrio cidicii]